jgi:lipopolysaccharide/colanic/teichoic acid biosynthesis glycosyltransferase
MKRFVDVVAALFGLLLMAPVLVFIALAVRIDSEGPALFRQTRVGRDGRTFQILKFRSMYHAYHGRDSGAQITAAEDPRITRFGALLRRSKLDELPQLINVLRGDMSLVGPRPEVPRYVAMYPPDARAEILSVRPGITDEAAIEFRDESEILGRSVDPERTYIEEILPRKIQLYKDYVRHRSLLSDLMIILRTLRRIVVSTSNDGA